MAKKKLKDFEKVGQNYFIVGQVKSVKKEDVISKTGTKYTKYESRITTPEGVSIFVKKSRFDKNKEPEFVTECYDYWESLLDKDFKETKEFVYIKANRKDGKTFYNWLTSYEKDDGSISYNIEGLLIHIDAFENEDESITLNFNNSASIFKDRETIIKARMYVSELRDRELLLTDNKEEFSNNLLVELSEGIENKAELGQAYDFRLKLKKGKKVQVESGTANWGDEDVVSTDYEPDKFIVDAVEGKVKGVKMSGVSAKKVEETEDCPF